MSLVFEGAIATKAAITSSRRKVLEVIMDKDKHSKDFGYIKAIASQKNIPIRITSKEEISSIATKNSHGGVICIVEERIFQPLSDLLVEEHPFLAILEGIEDPYNYASALRSLYAAGCNGVIVPTRNWSSADDIIIKASGGASEFMPTYKADDFQETIKELKKHNIKLYCALRNDAAISYFDGNYKEGICIAIGGEMRGLSKAIINENDQGIYIPYGNNYRNSLTAASSAAVIGFEVLRQRTRNGITQ